MLTQNDQATPRRFRGRTGSPSIRRWGRGFTLVEILMVVVILGIASAIIIPAIGNRDDMRAAAAGRVLVADLIFAQNQAITTGRKVYVRFDVANNKYALCTAVATLGDTYVTHPITQASYVQQFGPSARGWEMVTLQSAVVNGINPLYQPEFTLAFDEIGAPFVYCYDDDVTDDLQDGTIIVKAGQFTNTIRIAPATGEISISVP